MKHLRVSPEMDLRRWPEGCLETCLSPADRAISQRIMTPLDMAILLNRLLQTTDARFLIMAFKKEGEQEHVLI